jgi:hypothetical protein
MRVISTAVLGFCVISLLLATGIGALGQSPSPNLGSDDFARYAMTLRENAQLKIEPELFAPATNRPGVIGSAGGRYPWKMNIVTEIFWIGEPATGSRSAWDPEWERHYGGPDNPKASARHDYIPKNFTPKLNPFYCSLPYNDVTDGTTKPEARMVIPWFKRAYRKDGECVCQNRWVEIRNHNGRTCYAQWSDCGPFGTDQWQYVFGNALPAPNSNQGAALGVSPAIRDYLGLRQTDVTSWRFVESGEVPPGPWSNFGENNDFVINARRNPEHVASLPAGDGGTPTVISQPSPSAPALITR